MQSANRPQEGPAQLFRAQRDHELDAIWIDLVDELPHEHALDEAPPTQLMWRVGGFMGRSS